LTKQIYIDSVNFLQGALGVKGNRELLTHLWSIFKATSDEVWQIAVKEISLTYKPTATTPFPAPAYFTEAINKAKKEIRKRVQTQPMLISPDDLATQDDISQIMREAIKSIKSPPERERGTYEQG